MAKTLEDTPILIAQTGPLNGQRWALSNGVIVGREPDCEIVIPSRQVSRQHARFHINEGGVTLEDLGSKNGTHRNGQKIHDPVLLQDGDIISIALAQQFVFVSSDATMPLGPFEEEDTGSQPGMLRLEARSRRVWIGKQEIIPPLSLSQYSLLELLYQNQGRVVERKELVQTVWGEEESVGVSEQALDALVRRLRDRIAAIDPTHAYIVTIRGHGLRLDNPKRES